MTSFFFFAAIIYLLISVILFKRKGIFLIFILAWWFLWLTVSTISLTGVNVPSFEAYLHFFAFISAIFIGSILFKFNIGAVRRCSSATKEKVLMENKTEKIILKVLVYFVIPITTVLFFKAIFLFFTLDDLSLYRGMAFGFDEENSIIFGDAKIQFLYNYMVKPLSMTSFFIALSIYIKSSKKKLLILSSIVLAMDAVMMLGRFNLYYIIVMFSVAYLIKSNINFKSLFNTKSAAILAIVLFVIYLISLMRNTSQSLESIFGQLIVNYHTYSFTIYSNELQNPDSLLNQAATYGRASLGFIDTFITMVLRRFDLDLVPISTRIGTDLNLFQSVGFDAENNVIMANAFGSILYSIYLDGGFIFIIIFGVFFGFLITKLSTRALGLYAVLCGT